MKFNKINLYRKAIVTIIIKIISLVQVQEIQWFIYKEILLSVSLLKIKSVSAKDLEAIVIVNLRLEMLHLVKSLISADKKTMV